MRARAALAAAVAAACAVPPVAHGVGLVEPDLVLELVVGERVLRLLRQRVPGDRLQDRQGCREVQINFSEVSFHILGLIVDSFDFP